MPVPDNISKAQLLPTMQTGWEGLWAYLDTLSEVQLTQPKDAGGWTVKDHVIHLAVWEGSMNDVLQKKPRWEYMGVSLPAWESGEINRINDEIFQQNKNLTWAEVKERFTQEHDRLIAQVQALSEEDLRQPYSQAGRVGLDTIGHRLGIASYDHYAKHIPWIQKIVTSNE